MADDDRTARQIARGKRKRAGDRSTRLASAVMKLKPAAVKQLRIEDDLRDAIERARAVSSLIARRRAERTLAGDLRRFDVAELDRQLRDIETNNVDVRQFHLAETWRARLIDEPAAVAEFPGGETPELTRAIAAARQERATGRPPGAARALFRHIVDALKHAELVRDPAEDLAGGDDDGDDGAGDG